MTGLLSFWEYHDGLNGVDSFIEQLVPSTDTNTILPKNFNPPSNFASQ